MASINDHSHTLEPLIVLLREMPDLVFKECFKGKGKDVVKLLMAFPVKGLSRGFMADIAGCYGLYSAEKGESAHDFLYSSDYCGHLFSIHLSSGGEYLMMVMGGITMKIQEGDIAGDDGKVFTINGIRFIPETSLIELFASFIN